MGKESGENGIVELFEKSKFGLRDGKIVPFDVHESLFSLTTLSFLKYYRDFQYLFFL